MRKKIYQCLIALTLLVAAVNQAFAESNEPPIRFYSEIVAPYYWLDDSKQAQGAMVDLAMAIIDIIDREASIAHLPWARAIIETQKRPNIVLLTALRTTSREDKLQWLGKVGQTKAYLIGLNSSQLPELNHIEQAKSLKVATIRGYGAAAYLLDKGFVEGENLDLFVRIDQLWSMLYRQRIDAVLMNMVTSPFEIAQANLDPSAIKPILHIDELTINLEMATGNATSQATVMQIRTALQQLKDNGTYSAIMQRWEL
ncbi:transporter substrate-binding domain-containing protein [Alteromonas sp. ASW11-36]|uniref:Transporter substrate-binding domain-containing protein n=1 Tax=Alteromonas arenosi TaxID=3055817 RepID=A0ABT7STU8_9ALTE|nr:transporter substrate-binding domain-containing protein [Alteromonas sp. ASW11-36]MDM7859580.1 transporter substrate-binding domain-containing protein [Alteromonas sp. ASW11-36]